MSSSSSSSGYVVKAVLNGSTRRLTFNSPRLDYQLFRSKVATTFSLPPQGTKISFTDDDGDEIEISSQACLKEAISFFTDEDVSSSSSSRSASTRCVLRINVQVEYDGPGLSDYDPSHYSESTEHRSGRHGRSPERDRDHWSYDQDSLHRHDMRVPRSAGHPKHRAGQRLQAGLVRRASDGRQEHSQRWLAQMTRGHISPERSTHSRQTSLSAHRRPAHTCAPDEKLHCSSCWVLMDNLRYVCTVCGPTTAERTASEDGTEREISLHASAALENASKDLTALQTSDEQLREDVETSSSSSPSDIEGGTTPDSSLGQDDHTVGGFELCPACVQHDGATHAQVKSTIRHAFREIIKDATGSWVEVVFDDQVDCSSCGEEIGRRDRSKCLTCARFDLCTECLSRPGRLHSGHAFQSSVVQPIITISSAALGPPAPLENRLHLYRSLRSNASSPSIASARSSRSRPAARHIDCMCFGCLREVVGVRYHCADCQIDLCEMCENGDLAAILPQSDHELSHILLKVTVPIADAESLQHARETARVMGRTLSPHGRRGRSPGIEREHRHTRDSLGPDDQPRHHRHRQHGDYGPGPPRHFGETGPPFGGPHVGGGPFGPPPLFGGYHHFGGPGKWGPHHHRGPPPPSVYLINTGNASTSPGGSGNTINSLIPIPPTTTCAGCTSVLTGERWLCTGCPTIRHPYELVRNLSAKFLRARAEMRWQCSNCEMQATSIHDPDHVFVHLRKASLRPPPPSMRLLPPLLLEGSLRQTDAVHKGVHCDVCTQPVRGAWMHCVDCSSSFDMCSACYASTRNQHDERHAFIKFVRPVDMSVFRSLRQLDSESPVPLLPSLL